MFRVESYAEPIPGYKLIERLGGGGFGEVWKCEAPGGLHKAIKFVYGNLELAGGDEGQRAEQELKALSRVKTVRHPYILSLERFDIIEGQLLIVMELADRNLWDRYKECRAQGMQGIPRQELLGYIEEAAEALDLMNIHYQLQHLDIKPQNLFLVFQHVKVADFGLVKDLEGMQASVTGGITPVYAAPETFDGWVSRFSDQYSLAIVYQELLTGQRPFSGTSVRQLIMQHLSAAPNLSGLAESERAVIGRALSKTPEERFPTCRDLVQALRNCHQREEIAPSGGEMSLPPGTEPVYRTPVRNAPSSPELHLEETPSSQPGTLVGGGGKSSHPLSDSFQGTTRSIRGRQEGAAQEAESSPPGSAPIEVTSSGALMPTLVIGLGGMGAQLLQQLRQSLCRQFGSLTAIPHLRMLLLDTDAEATKAAASSALGTAALAPAEVLLAGLNRPSYYLKPQAGRLSCDSWLNQRLLYRIPREPITTGVRALGRLAFVDNYRGITRRILTELQAIVDPQALQTAARNTGLGIRTNRPRVYILTGLAGGTGSGMYLDLTYVVRDLLRGLGYSHPDVTGLLLVPAMERTSRHGAARDGARVLALGNTCAALTELYTYTDPEVVFTARYVEREPVLNDPDPPFNRCVIVPHPDSSDAKGFQEVLGMTGQYLHRDICSLLGRVSDLTRAGVSAPPWAERGRYFQTFGLHQLSFPRTEVVQGVARRLCHTLVMRWMSKDATALREIVQSWVQERWQELQLGAEHFIGRVQEHCQKVLGKAPETAFANALEGVTQRLHALLADPGRRPSSPPPELEVLDLRDALRRLEQLVGKPSEELSDSPRVLPKALHQAAEKLAAEWSQKLAEVAVRLIEEPTYRLAGAEEAIRQAVKLLEKILETHEPIVKRLQEQSGEIFTEICTTLSQVEQQGSWRRVQLTSKNVIDLLAAYAKTRYHSLVLGQVVGVYVSLRGHLSDTLREINFCRTRLKELRDILAAGDPRLAPPSEDQEPEPALHAEGLALHGWGRLLFPIGCENLEQAVQMTQAGLSEEQLLELDSQIQEMLKREYRALVHVCLTSAHITRKVASNMQDVAARFVDTLLASTDAAELFLQQYEQEGNLDGEIESLFEEAMPDFSVGRINSNRARSEISILAVPAGESGNALQEKARGVLTDSDLVTTTTTGDVVFYRELCNLPLVDMDHLGLLGQEAYRQLLAIEHFTPHSRGDLEFSPPPVQR